MKKSLMALLLASLTLPLLAKAPSQINHWNKVYSIDRMTQKALSTVSSGVLYLMLETPSNSSNVSNILTNVHDTLEKIGSHHDCYNALIKAYENATLSSAGKETGEKNKVWKKTLFSYYEDLTNRLENNSAITFGKHKGQYLRSILKKVPEVDLIMHNFKRPNQFKVAKRSVKKQSIVQVTLVTRTI